MITAIRGRTVGGKHFGMFLRDADRVSVYCDGAWLGDVAAQWFDDETRERDVLLQMYARHMRRNPPVRYDYFDMYGEMYER